MLKNRVKIRQPKSQTNTTRRTYIDKHNIVFYHLCSVVDDDISGVQQSVSRAFLTGVRRGAENQKDKKKDKNKNKKVFYRVFVSLRQTHCFFFQKLFCFVSSSRERTAV